MKGRTCILVTHHVRLCLPVAEMAIKMDSGNAQIEEIEAANLADLPDVSEDFDRSVETSTVPTNAQTTGVHTPMKATLITKEHRETVSSC